MIYSMFTPRLCVVYKKAQSVSTGEHMDMD